MRGGVDHHGTPPHAGNGARLRVDRGDGRVGARPDDGPRRLHIAVFVEVGDPVRQRPVADEHRVEDRLDTQGWDPVLYTEVDTSGKSDRAEQDEGGSVHSRVNATYDEREREDKPSVLLSEVNVIRRDRVDRGRREGFRTEIVPSCNIVQLRALLLVAQIQLPPPRGYVNDFAGALDSPSVAHMEAVIGEVRVKTRGEIAVVTLPDIAARLDAH